MSVSADAILVYGYDLGGIDDVRVEEANGEYGEPQVPWWSSDSVDKDNQPESVFDAMLRVLCVSTHEVVEWLWQRDDVVHKHYGVRIIKHCSDACPMYVLAAHSIRVYHGDIKHLDLAELAIAPIREKWDNKLHTAINALSIHPKQEKPGWLLVSDWS